MAATVSSDHRVSLRVGLAPVELPLRPWRARMNKLCEQVT